MLIYEIPTEVGNITEFLTLSPNTGICLPVMSFAMPHSVLHSYGDMDITKDYFKVEHHAT